MCGKGGIQLCSGGWHGALSDLSGEVVEPGPTPWASGTSCSRRMFEFNEFQETCHQCLWTATLHTDMSGTSTDVSQTCPESLQLPTYKHAHQRCYGKEAHFLFLLMLPLNTTDKVCFSFYLWRPWLAFLAMMDIAAHHFVTPQFLLQDQLCKSNLFVLCFFLISVY